MSAKDFKRVFRCYCKAEPCFCQGWEDELDQQGFDHLEFEDRHGNILLSNRGAGKLDDVQHARNRQEAATAMASRLSERRTILQHGTFGATPPGGRNVDRGNDRRIWELYAEGYGWKAIAKALDLPPTTVRGRIAEIRSMNQHLIAQPSLAELVKQCEPTTLVLFFALIKQALTDPASIEATMKEARKVPEIRKLIDPEQDPENWTDLVE